ncbi:54S ribosomal protein L27 mitochondrial [Spathaspora sp. JA1]|nr:54S ribosomal protein L27 mitochondrial [Spathaspora sp. JA1]
MRASQILNFQNTALNSLRRPWQTYKNGQLWYGIIKSGSKRHALTTKQGNHTFYKGTRSSGVGKLNARGQYIMNWDKVRTYVVPAELNTTELKALVSPHSPQLRIKTEGYNDGLKSAEYAFDSIVKFIEYGENYDQQDLEKQDYVERIVSPEVLEKENAESVELDTNKEGSSTN